MNSDENSYSVKPAVVDVTVDNPSASGQADIIGKPNRKTTIESDTGEIYMIMIIKSMMKVMMIVMIMIMLFLTSSLHCV